MLKADSKYDFDGIYKQESAEYDGLTEDAVLEEIAAQYLGVVFASEDNIRSTVASATDEQKGFLKKVVDYLKKFIEDIKELIRLYGDSDKTVRAAVQTPVDQLQYIADTFEDVLRKTAEIKKPATEEGGVKASRRLQETDLSNYLKAGERQNKNKLAALDNGQKIILTTKEEIIDYINNSVDKKHNGITVAYGMVNDRLAEEVSEASSGKIDITDYYLELVPFDLQHAFEQHHIAKEKGDVDLSREDFEKIPEYIDNYDELLYARRYSTGNTRICVGKKISNGRMLIIETVSKSRGAIQFKNAIGVSEEKYYSEYKKESGENSRGNEGSNISLRDSTAFNNTVSQNTQPVNNNDMQNNKKYSYGGVKAKTADIKTFDYAARLEDVGKASPEEIRQQTGWFRGYDNKWRFEISDRDMQIDTRGLFSMNPDVRRYTQLVDKAYFDMTATEEEMQELIILEKNLEGVSTEPKTLGELIQHPALFEAYPQLKDIKVYFDDIEPRGAYNPVFNEITLQKKLKLDKSKLAKTLMLHREK